ncbi:MAG TPA: aspartate aminotransferase family protein [Acidimicrobiales bacterium]|jgi:4-aminobutyrate aminotransferase-like enzyme|nr:aspartate aminotransferase family protein [Acidimicrobiales bacterium]|tara:strand:+ start:937 stop:2277 length:1341 start_codon:yes stop_codon:yes gene_type:complete
MDGRHRSAHYSSNEELRAVSERHVIKSMGDEPLAIASASGVRVTGADGREYLDVISGEWVVNLGYSHPKVSEAVKAQLDTADYTTPVWESEPRTLLAERLANLAPGDIQSALFGLSGAGAVEGAMHLAMRSTGGSDFVCLDGGYHGRTFGTIPLSYVYPEMYEGSNQGLDGYLKRQIRVPQYNCYRCPLSLQRETCDLACANSIDWSLERAHTHKPAGVIVESFQANGGMIPAPLGYMERTAEICKQREVALIVDEVQSAFCRTGPMFASEHYDIEPDIVVLGKALGGGFPLSAALATPEYSTLAPWEFGFTMAGHPVSCAAGLAMIDVMESDDLMNHSTRMGELIVDRLNVIKESSTLIGDVRGQGLMIGVELVQNRQTKEPAFAETAAVLEAALERGLMLGRTGPVFGNLGNVVKFKPAVNTAQADLEDALDRFESALQEVEGS